MNAKTKPKSVLLVAPHENERPAALRFQTALASKLESEGISVKENALAGSATRGWELRKEIIKGSLAKSGIDLRFFCNRVLSLEDLSLRAGIISKNLPSFSSVVELHAHASPDGDICNSALKRVGWTNFLYGTLQYAIELFLAQEWWAGDPLAAKIAKLRGFDLQTKLLGLKTCLSNLQANPGKTVSIEVPGVEAKFETSHPMQKIYSKLDRNDPFAGPCFYEIVYCMSNIDSIDFSSQDVSKVRSLIKFD